METITKEDIDSYMEILEEYYPKYDLDNNWTVQRMLKLIEEEDYFHLETNYLHVTMEVLVEFIEYKSRKKGMGHIGVYTYIVDEVGEFHEVNVRTEDEIVEEEYFNISREKIGRFMDYYIKELMVYLVTHEDRKVVIKNKILVSYLYNWYLRIGRAYLKEDRIVARERQIEDSNNMSKGRLKLNQSLYKAYEGNKRVADKADEGYLNTRFDCIKKLIDEVVI